MSGYTLMPRAQDRTGRVDYMARRRPWCRTVDDLTHEGPLTIRIVLQLALLALCAVPALAQDSVRTPASKFSKPVLLTNFGAYIVNYSEPTYTFADGVTSVVNRRKMDARVLADWGVIIPVSERSRVGLSAMVSLDNDYSFVAIFARYRRMLDSVRSIEVALGVPTSNGPNHRAAPLGLIKYNMMRHFGVALRPEINRYLEYTADPASPFVRSSFRMSAGVELGGLAGAITSVTAGLAFLAALISFFASGGFW